MTAIDLTTDVSVFCNTFGKFFSVLNLFWEFDKLVKKVTELLDIWHVLGCIES